SASVARRKGLTLKLARRSTTDSFARAVELAASRGLGLERLVSRRVALQDVLPAIAGFVARDGMKVVVEPGGSAPDPPPGRPASL
ncbi:MAG: hypothetical protein QOJ75_1773, partial [Chloroflexota bacterium]|nr:hypothetical protein [Chloroflexota bacterium]